MTTAASAAHLRRMSTRLRLPAVVGAAWCVAVLLLGSSTIHALPPAAAATSGVAEEREHAPDKASDATTDTAFETAWGTLKLCEAAVAPVYFVPGTGPAMGLVMDWLCLVPAAAEIELLIERRGTGEELVFTETLGALLGAKLAYQLGAVPLGVALALGIFVGTTTLVLAPVVAGLTPVTTLPALALLGAGTAVPAAVLAALMWHDVRVAFAEQLFAGVVEAAGARGRRPPCSPAPRRR